MAQYTQFKGDVERDVLIAMIVSDAVLGRVSSLWKEPDGLFASRWSNTLARLCVKHFRKFNHAPNEKVQSLLSLWQERHPNLKNEAELMWDLLTSLNDQYKQLRKHTNAEYALDLAQKLFDKVAKERLCEEIKASLDVGDCARVDKLLAQYRPLALAESEGAFLEDESVWRDAFADRPEPIVTYPGALGEFFGGALERDGFIAFCAPEKRGKSFWLIDLAWRAMEQRRRVAFFGAGDMSRRQYIKRFAARASGRPAYPRKILKPQGVEFTKYKTKSGREVFGPRVTGFDEVDHTDPLTWRSGHASYLKILKQKCKSRGELFWIDCHPNSSLSVAMVKAKMEEKQRQGWTPDVIVIDYADIMLHPEGAREDTRRDRVNATWKQLRALSQSLHCLVVTATQANAESYQVNTLGMGNFSEDHRKNAEVTGMIGINVSLSEKEQGVSRLNWLALREDEFSSVRTVAVAGCLAVANPALRSAFAPKGDGAESDEEAPARNGKPARA